MTITIFVVAAAGLLGSSASAHDWTPHTAAAVLDADFPSAAACQAALDAARATESNARPVHGLSYGRLFEAARCQGYVHHGKIAWHIRAHWPRVKWSVANPASSAELPSN